MAPNLAVEAPPERFNVAAHLLQRNAGRAAKTAYIDDDSRLSYGELADRVKRCAAGLLRLGLRREDRVLLLMLDTVDMPVAFLGALYAGIVPVPVNTLLPAGDYTYMLAHSRARALIVSGALWPVAQQALAGLDEPPVAVIAGASAAPAADGTTAFAALLDTPPLAAPADTQADDFAFWLYSSGSTGKPKGTVHSHANLYWTAALYGQPVLGVREDDTVFSAAKLFFAYGLGNALTFPLSVGATVVLMAERPTPAAVFKRLTQHRPTVFCGVPTLYVALLANDALPVRDAVALRVCASAGEALPREVGERFSAHFGCDVLDGIGSTEMLHIFLSNREGALRYGCTGKPVPGYELELRSDDGGPVAPGEIGDLFIRGPSAALLYWNNRDKTRATFQGDWVRSGDKYVVDADGWYTYAGRSDDMLKVSGQYVSPIEVESALMGHAAVMECAVVGVTDATGLTKTRAYVVPNPGHDAGPALEAALKVFVKTRLAPHKTPRDIVFTTELPKTATGKIQRFRLRALGDTPA
ncbi:MULTISPECIES: benzoate-CoA ligase family protein [unclassified Rhizobacter]|uniref:benzoate-CoA ligase family protein n=1 Tax=unclassified Rhizobacter TaxID=2640088 RepID=UPI0006F2536A|nr:MULTISPECIES: benzoate-CoA ligase family protein [unclassified Rhizobacter]KQU67761.1 4-hydroxybenzoate--CoA ligase [Rhizobacter sp. Root29]KQW15355.1 4-hydroxybenzoate--CoA ligase [Rhizobacter sp. Root1238]KRB24499.1 4-hydroxybenzoate--CoA ligase [Rhizobacter sp. Root16D2]